MTSAQRELEPWRLGLGDSRVRGHCHCQREGAEVGRAQEGDPQLSLLAAFSLLPRTPAGSLRLGLWGLVTRERRSSFLLCILSCDNPDRVSNRFLTFTSRSFNNFPILIFVFLICYDLAYFDSFLFAKSASLSIVFPVKGRAMHGLYPKSWRAGKSFLLSLCLNAPGSWWKF